jgi:hypothetical protein
MLTAVELDNQLPREAAEIGKVGTNPVLPAELNLPQRLALRWAHNFPSSEVNAARRRRPQSRAEWGGRPCPPFCRTHKSRASEGALTKDPLLAPKKGAVLPLSGEENYGRNCRNSSPSPTFSCGRGRGEGSGTLQAPRWVTTAWAFPTPGSEKMSGAGTRAPRLSRQSCILTLWCRTAIFGKYAVSYGKAQSTFDTHLTAVLTSFKPVATVI